MIEDDTDLSRMLRVGVSIDEFDPTNLLSQPINFDESIDELDINLNEETGHNSYNDLGNGNDAGGDRHNETYSNESFFRTTTPNQEQYGHDQTENANSPRRHSPHDYEPPPYKHSPNRSRQSRSPVSTKFASPPRGDQRQNASNSERIAQVQQQIRQVQQQIHENMDDNRHNGRPHMDDRPHRLPYRQEHGYPPRGYREERHYDNPPPRHRFSSPHRGRPMRGEGDVYGYPQRRSTNRPMQQPPHRGPRMMSPPPPHRDPMHQSHNGSRGYPRGSPPPQHVLGGMSNALRQSNNGPPPHAPPMARSYNGGNMQNMNASSNGNAPRRGIQSMSESLNGMANAPMNRSRNGMDSSTAGRGIQSMSASLQGVQNVQGRRGIQSMSASLNGMSQSMNSVQGYGGPESMNRSINGMHGHPLHGMSQSLNSVSGAPYRGPHPTMRMKMDNSNSMGMMNRSNNGMGRSMNSGMNASTNGLNNTSVPSAPLLNQVSNLANLPNQGGNSAMMQGPAGSNTTKLSRKLMEAMKRTASSRKLIRELNIAAMLRGDMKSAGKQKTVVKAKRNASRQSYTKSQSEAAASREFMKAQKEQEQKEEPKPQPLQVAV